MNLANILWVVNVALELVCLWVLSARGWPKPLTVFVAWQMVVEMCGFAFATTPVWPMLYWLAHSVTYIMLLALLAPKVLSRVAGVYWLASFAAAVFLIADTWMNVHKAQYALAGAVGAISLFAALTSYLTTHKSPWLCSGVATWSLAQILAIAFPPAYGTIYTTGCAIALILFTTSTHHLPLPPPHITSLPLTPKRCRVPDPERFRLSWN